MMMLPRAVRGRSLVLALLLIGFGLLVGCDSGGSGASNGSKGDSVIPTRGQRIQEAKTKAAEAHK